MATATAKRRSAAKKPAAAKRAKPAARKRTGAAPKKGAVKQAAQALTPAKSSKKPLSGLAALAARKAVKAVVRRAARSGAQALRSAADRTAVTGRAAVESALSKRLPIQVSVDVAVPLPVAWEEWMGASSMTEGIHRIEDVERDGDHLTGTVAGPRSTAWEADIVDERQHESFAWRSTAGSDCAGLVTFHRLSDRLTRIEVDLDVLPTNPAQAVSMSLHLAHRHADAELRRFKAHAEFINPDVYEPQLSQNGGEPESED